MDQNYGKLQAFVRIDGNGNMIPGTNCYKPFGTKIADGRWLAITGNYCCGSNDGFVLFQNTTSSANITNIQFGNINWTGALGNGLSIIFPLANGYDYNIAVTVDTPSGRTITTAVLAGKGSITAGGAITLATNTYTTSATPSSQYSIVLS